MDDHGKYALTVVDHLSDVTRTVEIPENQVGYLPLIMAEIEKRFSG